MRMTQTEVPPALGGRGIAAALVEAAFEHARTHGLKVEPWCSYVRVYLQRHPEAQPLLPPGFKL
jgi:predicted GNAT family acetyltransferase